MPKSISIEAENLHDSATMFSLRIDDAIIGRGLTAAQVHLLVGEILERIALPHHKKPQFLDAPSDSTSKMSIQSTN